MAHNKEKGLVFDEDHLETLIWDLEFEIFDHTTIIPDLRHKVRCLKQELENCDEARRFRTLKSYNSVVKSLDGKAYGMLNLMWPGVIGDKVKSVKPMIMEAKKSERKVYIESCLTTSNEGTSNETRVKGKEKVIVEACKTCKQTHYRKCLFGTNWCYRCGMVGHFVRHCNNKARGSGKSSHE